MFLHFLSTSKRFRRESYLGRNVISEELKEKLKQSASSMKHEINSIQDEIRRSCNSFRYASTLRTMVNLRNKDYQEVMSNHTKKIARLLYKETDVDEHIQNISSYDLSFSQKLVLCRGLKFAFPERVSSIIVKASFEKAYWSLEPHLGNDDLKELAVATLRFVALNYLPEQSTETFQDTSACHRTVETTRRHCHHQTR